MMVPRRDRRTKPIEAGCIWEIDTRFDIGSYGGVDLQGLTERIVTAWLIRAARPVLGHRDPSSLYGQDIAWDPIHRAQCSAREIWLLRSGIGVRLRLLASQPIEDHLPAVAPDRGYQQIGMTGQPGME
jgi:hypothetical protein